MIIRAILPCIVFLWGQFRRVDTRIHHGNDGYIIPIINIRFVLVADMPATDQQYSIFFMTHQPQNYILPSKTLTLHR
jgi:hypothetical protein